MNIQILSDFILRMNSRKIRRNIENPIKEWPQKVVSEQMGCDRGTPVDRYYIEKFLEQNIHYIVGDVMEIGDNSYTLKYGKKLVESYIFTADTGFKNKSSKVVYGDLQSGMGCQENYLDCFILTQTLPFIYDVQSAANNIVKMLKEGGTALITVSGISMVSKYDDSRWGHYWGFTETGLRKLFESVHGVKSVEIQAMGNPKTAAAFLYGLCVQDLAKSDFEVDDKLVPVMISAVVKK